MGGGVPEHSLTPDPGLSWIQFQDGLGRTYDHRGQPTHDETWRPWWRKLLGIS